MPADLVKCPHCFGEKPGAAKVCLHCGRDEHGFGPMVRSNQAVMVQDTAPTKKWNGLNDLKIHLVAAILATTLGFFFMLSSGLGSLLFILGITLLLTTKARIWWRQRLDG